MPAGTCRLHIDLTQGFPAAARLPGYLFFAFLLLTSSLSSKFHCRRESKLRIPTRHYYYYYQVGNFSGILRGISVRRKKTFCLPCSFIIQKYLLLSS
ncbi:hypothetical protein F4774DRAFT_374937 [Daldinia eschscholtzii]|nr:hypothetical protein F4774DRAFT_374937 [Daldinia eschscholtzii]